MEAGAPQISPSINGAFVQEGHKGAVRLHAPALATVFRKDLLDIMFEFFFGFFSHSTFSTVGRPILVSGQKPKTNIFFQPS
jgi:hypothetical protein